MQPNYDFMMLLIWILALYSLVMTLMYVEEKDKTKGNIRVRYKKVFKAKDVEDITIKRTRKPIQVGPVKHVNKEAENI